MAEVRSTCCYCGVGCGQASLREADRFAEDVERRSRVLINHG